MCIRDRVILRADANAGNADHLGEPWAVPVAETKLDETVTAGAKIGDNSRPAMLAGQIIDFLPTFAGQPGVLLRQLWLANPDVAQAAVVDSAGEQVSALAVELEERRLLGAPGESVHLADRAAPAVIVALGVGVGCFADEAGYAASPASLLDPSADPGEPPAQYVENGWPWPPRLGAQSFLSHGVWGEPAQSEAYARLAGIVSRVDTRVNTLTGQRFHVARVRSFEMELDVCLAADEHLEPPVVGGVVAGTAFLTGTLLP